MGVGEENATHHLYFWRVASKERMPVASQENNFRLICWIIFTLLQGFRTTQTNKKVCYYQWGWLGGNFECFRIYKNCSNCNSNPHSKIICNGLRVYKCFLIVSKTLRSHRLRCSRVLFRSKLVRTSKLSVVLIMESESPLFLVYVKISFCILCSNLHCNTRNPVCKFGTDLRELIDDQDFWA